MAQALQTTQWLATCMGPTPSTMDTELVPDRTTNPIPRSISAAASGLASAQRRSRSRQSA